MSKIILETAYGNITGYQFSLEKAFELFEEYCKDSSFLQEWNPPYFSKNLFVDRVKKVITSPLGSEINGIILTKEMQTELILFFLENDINFDKKSFDSYKFFNVFSFEKLPFLKGMSTYKDVETVVFIDDFVAEINQSYQTIKNRKFKDDVSEERKVKYILDFLNKLQLFDIKYEIIDIKI